MIAIEADSEDFMVFEALSTTTESSIQNQDRGNREMNKKLKNRSRKPGWTKSDASPSYTKATSSFKAKKDCCQEPAMTLTRKPSIKLKSPLLRKLSGGTDSKKKLNKSRSIKLSRTSTLKSRSRFSQVHPVSDLSIERATCSSTIKNAKFPANVPEAQPETAVEKACPYSYCSLHGHRHGNSSQLKKVASIRRRAVKTPKSKKAENQSSVKAKKRGIQVSTASSEVKKEADSMQDCVRVPSKTEMENRMTNSRLWHLIYQHMVTGLAAEGETKPPSATEVDSVEAVEDHNERRQKLEFRKNEAIKVVQAAFDKILSEIPDNSSDDQSVPSSKASDHEVLLKKQDEEEAPKMQLEIDSSIASEEDKAVPVGGDASERKMPNRWSNLKKVIILNKFVKALGKVRNFDPEKPRHLALESDPEAENVQLKRQTMEERKNAEEWMLDYALRQVISTLAPSHKRKVTLLVQAYETVIPSETGNGLQSSEAVPLLRTPAQANNELSANDDDCLQKPNDSEILLGSYSEINSGDVPNPANGLYTDREYIPKAFPEPEKPEDPGKPDMLEPANEVSHFHEKVSVSDQASNEFTGDAVSYLNFEDNNGGPHSNSAFIYEASQRPSESSEKKKEASKKGFLEPTDVENRENYGLWSLIYQRLAANIETQPPTSGEDSTENVGRVEFGSSHSISETDQLMGTEDPHTKSQKLEFSKSNVIKLVREAFDKILPEIPDSSSDNQSIASDVARDQELMSQKDDMGPEISTSPDSAREIMEHNSEHSLTVSDEEKATEMEGKLPGNDMPNNWSRLKKMIILKRFVKAMEKMRNINPRTPQYLPMQHDSEAEKVDLRHQTLEERKKSEEMMLDYALRQVISSLAPSQKRKVALLVQAFETVGPQPETGLSCSRAASPQTTSFKACYESSDPIGENMENHNGIIFGSKTVSEMSFRDAPDQASDLSPAFVSEVQDRDTECNIKEMEYREPTDVANEHPGKAECPKEVNAGESIRSCQPSNEFAGDTVSSLKSEDNKGGPLSNNLGAVSNEPTSDSAFAFICETSQRPPESSEKKKEASKKGFLEPTDMENGENYGLWSLIYQRLAANIEIQPLINGEDSTENVDQVEFGSSHSISETDQLMGTEDPHTKSQKLEISKSNAIKLVREAFDKILSEIPDSSLDNQSIASDIASDQEFMSQKDDMGPDILTSLGSTRQIMENNSENLLTVSGEKFTHMEGPGNHMPKNWSRLKKMIILKRFVKAMEKVRNINPRTPRHLPMQPDSEAEKVNLRHQTLEERKKSEEMMLDYALRQVISSLAPSQKRKVALLVQAFETVGPRPETGLSCSRAASSPTTSQIGDNLEIHNDSETLFGCKTVSEMSFRDAPDQASGFSPAFGSEVQDSDIGCNIKEMKYSKSTDVADEHPGKAECSKEVDAGESIRPRQGSASLEESDYNYAADVETETKSEKQKCIRFWYLLSKHMASSTSAEDDDPSTLHAASLIEESQNEVIKLVEEAIDEIPLPENQDDSSNDKSITSDTVSVQDLQEKRECEGDEQLIPAFTDFAKDCSGESNTRALEIGTIDRSNEPMLNSENVSTQKEEKTVASLGKRMKPQAKKNWSNLKKLIILRRFVKAVEKVEGVKAFIPWGPNYLPAVPTQESEKVHLRRQDVGDRKNTEEWMLDSALQNVVSKLTPARKRRVQLLVEAFETVVPTFGS